MDGDQVLESDYVEVFIVDDEDLFILMGLVQGVDVGNAAKAVNAP